MDHPLVRQTIDDCLSEATDIDGLIEVLKGLRDGSIERVAMDTHRAVGLRAGNSQLRALHVPRRCPAGRAPHAGGAEPAHAGCRARSTTWALSIRRPSSGCARKPGRSPESAEEVHDALLWLGFVTDEEAADWTPWLMTWRARIVSSTPTAAVVRGRWSVRSEENPARPAGGAGPGVRGRSAIALRRRGEVAAAGIGARRRHPAHAAGRPHAPGASGGCWRAFIVPRSNELRREIEPVSAGEFLQFLACWQHVDEDYRLEGPRGVAEVLGQLAGIRGAGMGVGGARPAAPRPRLSPGMAR